MANPKRKRKTPDQTTVVTGGSTIRIETPHSGRQHKPNPAVVIVQENNPVTGFVQFLRDHAVVGLAIGFIVGQQANSLVKQFVETFVDPTFKLVFGKALTERTLTLNWHDRSVPFPWGSFAYSLLSFFFVVIAIYITVKLFKLNKLEKAEEAKK